MTQNSEAKTWTLPAITGDVQIKCSVCGHDTFLDTGPPNVADRKGFTHVTIGLTGKKELAFKIIRRKFCANCGYIMEFMIPGGGN